MFLDEELEKIYIENGGCNTKTSVALVKACQNRWADPTKKGSQAFINSVKQTDSSWRLFCKRHPEYKPEGLRVYFLKLAGDNANYMKKILRW